MNAPLIILHPDDHVAIARTELAAGASLPGCVTATGVIPSGHKVAMRAIAAGDTVRKFGHPIGAATSAIAAGDHVHTHNLAMPTARGRHNLETASYELPPLPEERYFDGYARTGGRVGTRNFIGILTTVNCSATVARQIAERAKAAVGTFLGVDGVVALTHSTGCGMASHGEGMDNLRRTLAGFAQHPNFGGVLIIGLGCEANQMAALLAAHGLCPSDRLRTLTIQSAGGTRRAIEQGLREVLTLMEIANADRRTRCHASGLVLGLQCGGSDGWSGVSANPALGAASDLVVRAGGSVFLAETPEIYGAESLLLRRARSIDVADALLQRIAWWEDYVARNGQVLDNNPSPGNLRGGLTTILEKSLGAVAKSGSARLEGILRYGEARLGPGLHFMDSPGYDPCSVTGEIASGANLIAFTTGRGSVFGAKPVPSIKIASNRELAENMDEDIDISAADIIDGKATPETIGTQIFELLLDTASGQRSASEKLGFGDLEFVPWQIGATV